MFFMLLFVDKTPGGEKRCSQNGAFIPESKTNRPTPRISGRTASAPDIKNETLCYGTVLFLIFKKN